MSTPASRRAKGEGKRLRRARNIVKRYAGQERLAPKLSRRLSRAMGIIVATTLAES